MRSCGTEEPTGEARLAARWELEELRQFRQAQGRVSDWALLSIPVQFHVLHDGGTGWVSESLLRDQVQVLNSAFSGELHDDGVDSRITFTYVKAAYVNNARYHKDCKSSSYTFREQYTDDPTRNLNVFVCSGSGLLGWTYLPTSHAEGSHNQAIIMDYRALPRNGYDSYDMGYTLVHEVTHHPCPTPIPPSMLTAATGWSLLWPAAHVPVGNLHRRWRRRGG